MLKKHMEMCTRWRRIEREAPTQLGGYDVVIESDCGCCKREGKAEWNGFSFESVHKITHWCFPRPLPLDD
jgi:hypothetical protein